MLKRHNIKKLFFVALAAFALTYFLSKNLLVAMFFFILTILTSVVVSRLSDKSIDINPIARFIYTFLMAFVCAFYLEENFPFSRVYIYPRLLVPILFGFFMGGGVLISSVIAKTLRSK